MGGQLLEKYQKLRSEGDMTGLQIIRKRDKCQTKETAKANKGENKGKKSTAKAIKGESTGKKETAKAIKGHSRGKLRRTKQQRREQRQAAEESSNYEWTTLGALQPSWVASYAQVESS